MADFTLYFQLGFKHIADIKGIDHILFVIVLCTRYQFSDWQKVLILVTAFTIGHSITLALSTVNMLRYQTGWIEFLIPLTILITACGNLWVKKFTFKSRFPVIYFMALFFGLIHGLGFSSYLRSLLGKHESILIPLLGFNTGLEIGQVLIVVIYLLIAFIFITVLKFNRRECLLFVNGGIFFIALQMTIDRYPL